MVERGYDNPKVAIFGSDGVLLYESTEPKLFGERSLKHIIDTLRVMQRESNEFLTSLVNEQSSQRTDKNAVIMDKDSADEEDDEDEENSAVPKKRKQD